MDAQEVAARQAEGGIAITARVGALMLPLAVPVLVVAEYLHPHREDPMEISAVTIFLVGLAVALGSVYPRWTGLVGAVSGSAFVCDGLGVVAYEGFVPSTIKLVGLLSLAVWAFVMAPLMWRNGGRWRISRPEPIPPGPAQRSVGAR